MLFQAVLEWAISCWAGFLPLVLVFVRWRIFLLKSFIMRHLSFLDGSSMSLGAGFRWKSKQTSYTSNSDPIGPHLTLGEFRNITKTYETNETKSRIKARTRKLFLPQPPGKLLPSFNHSRKKPPPSSSLSFN